MNKNSMQRGMAGGLILCGLSACGTIKSWFPDKERDYQFTSEIPELIIPDDLKNKGLERVATAEPAASADEAGPVSASAAANPETGAEADVAQDRPDNHGVGASKTEPSEPAAAETNAEAQTEASAPAGASSLQIDQAKMPATRMVGRALTRKKVEIVERNIDKGYFYVKYDPDAVQVKDESIWDEFNFLFGDDPSREQEYRISVRGLGPQTSEVTVQDEQGKNLSSPAANALLKLITEGINQAVDQNDEPEVPAQPATGQQPAENTENPAAHD
ncbi:outer membrane protein assembly factor BamC [Methylomonas sp. SURF-2]|uniref:Outer membrane protein assembly factor BamC n=1 Tax=Methylomonas subterranea TaxID=2952225 RepID=A0ABT1TDZ0_9GAMM|nr:outer membrane protein assembly factor BamC [Methylomonas sp. SURF-2]MCQ8103670.1 outer membrane protein assembly factor BamC [Methylomonas sp. SURF-2]